MLAGGNVTTTGQRVLYFRSYYEVSQVRFARKCGIKVETLRSIEQNRSKPNLPTLRKLASFLTFLTDQCIDPADLLGSDDTEASPWVRQCSDCRYSDVRERVGTAAEGRRYWKDAWQCPSCHGDRFHLSVTHCTLDERPERVKLALSGPEIFPWLEMAPPLLMESPSVEQDTPIRGNQQYIGGRLRSLREYLGVSQAVLAQAAEIRLDVLRDVEIGTPIPPMPVIRRIATVLSAYIGRKIDPADLLDDDNLARMPWVRRCRQCLEVDLSERIGNVAQVREVWASTWACDSCGSREYDLLKSVLDFEERESPTYELSPNQGDNDDDGDDDWLHEDDVGSNESQGPSVERVSGFDRPTHESLDRRYSMELTADEVTKLGVISVMTYRDSYDGCLRWKYGHAPDPDGPQGAIRAEYHRIGYQLRELGRRYGIKGWRISRIDSAIYHLSHKMAAEAMRNELLVEIDKAMGWRTASGESTYHMSPEREQEYLSLDFLDQLEL